MRVKEKKNVVFASEKKENGKGTKKDRYFFSSFNQKVAAMKKIKRDLVSPLSSVSLFFLPNVFFLKKKNIPSVLLRQSG